MASTEPSAAVQFADEDLTSIAAVLPPEAAPERVALLPELLRAWAAEDLGEHLSLEGRAIHRQRSARLAAVGKAAGRLIDAVRKLDEEGQFEIACGPQMQREFAIGEPRWARTAGGGLTISRRGSAGATRRWLGCLVDALGEPEWRPPPDKRTRSYVVVLDLWAMFEILTCTEATRRIDSSKPYGPFWDFLTSVCRSLPQMRSLDRAIRDVMTNSAREYSAFIANLQFRHPELWQKLR
jgi:hypothetical protein